MKLLAIMAAALAPLTASGAYAADTDVNQRPTAECAVREDARSVAALLGALPGSDDEARAATRLSRVFTACSSDTILLGVSTGSRSLYNGRAELAAAALNRAFDRGGADMSRVASMSPWYAGAVAGRTAGRGYDSVALGMQEFGTCVAKAAPDASVQLVRSAAGSEQERQARAAIKPVLAGCVVQGKPLSIKLDMLRLMIAEPLYHAIVDGPSAGRRS